MQFTDEHVDDFIKDLTAIATAVDNVVNIWKPYMRFGEPKISEENKAKLIKVLLNLNSSIKDMENIV